MTQEQKRIKIAEACGWKHIERLRTGWYGCHEQSPFEELPDYFSDLNACHNMEKSLCSIDHWIRFEKYLAELGTKFIWHATATQRAEAFGLTLKLWK